MTVTVLETLNLAQATIERLAPAGTPKRASVQGTLDVIVDTTMKAERVIDDRTFIGPVWAWELVWEHLEVDAHSPTLGPTVRLETQDAIDAIHQKEATS